MHKEGKNFVKEGKKREKLAASPVEKVTKKTQKNSAYSSSATAKSRSEYMREYQVRSKPGDFAHNAYVTSSLRVHFPKIRFQRSDVVRHHLIHGLVSFRRPGVADNCSRAIQRRLAEGHLASRRPLRVLPLMLNHRRLRLEWCRARGNWTAAEWNQVVFSDESRFNSAVITIVFVCEDLVVND
ncbi:transposable element Tcb2 transposase [Trichonephila clavipes]|nr:transposable element Tcb2 transposase [Trichonephila clavipes]